MDADPSGHGHLSIWFLTFKSLEGLGSSREDRRAGSTSRRRPLGRPLVRGGRDPSGCVPRRQRLSPVRRSGRRQIAHWGLDDPSEVEGSDDDKLAAFRRTQVEVSARLRPFIEVAIRAAGRRPTSSLPA
jgi:hypothetical protein